ncbi:MAG: hypothetical protein WA954_06340 [Parerythrobacter sp.]
MIEQTGLVAIYRWRVAPEDRAAFCARWANATEELRAKGGQGSMLGEAADGTLYAIAKWPDRATRKRAFAEQADATPWPEAERFEPVLLDTLDNRW